MIEIRMRALRAARRSTEVRAARKRNYPKTPARTVLMMVRPDVTFILHDDHVIASAEPVDTLSGMRRIVVLFDKAHDIRHVRFQDRREHDAQISLNGERVGWDVTALGNAERVLLDARQIGLPRKRRHRRPQVLGSINPYRPA